MKIEEFIRYRTPDGSVFDNKGAAYEHAIAIRVLEIIFDADHYEDLNRTEIAERVLTNADELIYLLTQWRKECLGHE